MNKIALLLMLVTAGPEGKRFTVGKDQIVQRFYDDEMGVACYTVVNNTYVATISCVKVKDNGKEIRTDSR